MKRLTMALGACALALSAPFAALAGTVLIPEGNANDVLVVDADSGKTLNVISGLDAIHGLAGAPGVKYLVAGSYAEIDRADVAGAAKPKNMSANDHAAHHAKKPETVMPQDMGLSLVSILDAKTGEVVRRIEVPGAVHHTAVSPDGRWAVATHPAGDGISIIDLENLTYKAFIQTGPIPNYAVFAPEGGKVYVTNAGNGTLSEVDFAQGFVTRNIKIGETPEHVVLNKAGTAAFVADAEAGRALRVDLATGKVTGNWEIGGEIHGIDLSDNEAVLFVAGKGSDRLVSIDLETDQQRVGPLAPNPYHLTTAPGTGKLYVSSRAEPKVWIVDQATMRPVGEIAINGVGHQMVALP